MQHRVLMATATVAAALVVFAAFVALQPPDDVVDVPAQYIWRVDHPSPGRAIMASFSADGTQLAWVAENIGSHPPLPTRLAIVDVGARGLGTPRIVPQIQLGNSQVYPQWRGRDDLVFVSVTAELSTSISSWQTSNSSPAPLIGSLSDSEPALHPSGWIGATFGRDGQYDPMLWRDGELLALPATGAREGRIDFGPDGELVAYHRRRHGTIIASMRTLKTVAEVEGRNNLYPALYDDDSVLFFRGKNQAHRLLTANWRTGSERVLSTKIKLPAHHLREAMTPDRRFVVVSHFGDQKQYLEVIDLEGGQSVRFRTDTGRTKDPALGIRDGRVLMAWTGEDGEERPLYVADITRWLPR